MDRALTLYRNIFTFSCNTATGFRDWTLKGGRNMPVWHIPYFNSRPQDWQKKVKFLQMPEPRLCRKQVSYPRGIFFFCQRQAAVAEKDIGKAKALALFRRALQSQAVTWGWIQSPWKSMGKKITLWLQQALDQAPNADGPKWLLAETLPILIHALDSWEEPLLLSGPRSWIFQWW